MDLLKLNRLVQYSAFVVLGMILCLLGSYDHFKFEQVNIAFIVVTLVLMLGSIMLGGRRGSLLFLFNSVVVFLVLLAVFFSVNLKIHWHIFGLIIVCLSIARWISNYSFEGEKYFEIKYIPCALFLMSETVVIIAIMFFAKLFFPF